VGGANTDYLAHAPRPPATPLPDAIYPQLDLIRPDATEASTLTGVDVRDRASAREAARVFLDRGAQAAVIQAGSEGNLAVWPGGELWLPKIPVKSVDAVGAGDAFAAALAVQMAKGRSLAEAGSFANAAAALATTVVGARAGLPRREAVARLLAEVQAGAKSG
jgi:ribokinase